MKLFQKLDLNNIIIDIEKVRVPHRTEYGKTFFEYAVEDNGYLKDKLNQLIEFKIPPHAINITEIIYPGAIPHTDAWTVGLNYYFTAGEDTTYYFEEINKSVSTNRVKDTNVKMYDQRNLKVIDTFVANQHDWYLLDTSVPHAVKCPKEGSIRTMLRFIWYRYSFDAILNSIIIKK